jgi:hypothetical protein
MAVCLKAFGRKIWAAAHPCHFITRTVTLTATGSITTTLDLCWDNRRMGWRGVTTDTPPVVWFLTAGSGSSTPHDCHCGCGFTLSRSSDGGASYPMSITDCTGIMVADPAVDGLSLSIVYGGFDGKGANYCYPQCKCCGPKNGTGKILTGCYSCHALGRTLFVSDADIGSLALNWNPDLLHNFPEYLDDGTTGINKLRSCQIGNESNDVGDGGWISDGFTLGDTGAAVSGTLRIYLRCCGIGKVVDDPYLTPIDDGDHPGGGCHCGCLWALNYIYVESDTGIVKGASNGFVSGQTVTVDDAGVHNHPNVNCEPLIGQTTVDWLTFFSGGDHVRIQTVSE